MKKFLYFLTSVLAVLAFTLPAHAVIISFMDPVGDHTGIVDVVGMTFDIDTATGGYTIDLSADGANPFDSAFRVNINLWNVTRAEFFQDTFNDFNLSSSQTTLQLTGTNGNLTDWLETDTIATSTFAGLGNPPSSSFFRSSVADLPFQPVCVAEDIIGLDGCASAPVPEPSTLLLLGSGLLGLVGFRRKFRS